MIVINNTFIFIALTTEFKNKANETLNKENLNESKNITDSEVGANRFPGNGY